MSLTIAERAELDALKKLVAELREEMGPRPATVSAYPFPYPQNIYDVHGRIDQIGKGTDDAAADAKAAKDAVAAFIANPPVPPPNVQLPANSLKLVNPATGLVCVVFISENDDGFRLDYNFLEPAGANGTHSVPAYPQVLLGVEREGAFSIAGFRPRTGVAGPWDNKGGKSFKLYPLGYGSQVTGQATEFVSIASCSPGRGLELMVSDAPDANASMYRPKLQVRGDGSANPVSIYVNGQLRQIGVDQNDKLVVL